MIEEIKLPDIGDGIEGGVVIKVLVKEGSEIEIDSFLMELETDKAVFEFPSTKKGTIVKVRVSPSEYVKVGQVLFDVEVQGATGGHKIETSPTQVESKKVTETHKLEASISKNLSEEKPPTHEQDVKSVSSRSSQSVNVSAGPAARLLARELGVNLTDVKGTGSGNRITLDDVKALAKAHLTAPSSKTGVTPFELPDFTLLGAVERKPLGSLRRKTAEKLERAWTEVPIVTQFDEADITELEAIRKNNSQYVKDKGGRLTITVFLLKAVTLALKAFPQFNSSLDLQSGEAVYKFYYNIGVAVDTPTGLIVPVIKNVDQKSIVELSSELAKMAQKARDRKVTPDDIRGGNISISNLGGISGSGFTPLVVPPDVAVIGVSRSSFKPIWRDAKFEPRLIMPFSVSYDHRMIDGADGARFSQFLAQMLENPARLLMEG